MKLSEIQVGRQEGVFFKRIFKQADDKRTYEVMINPEATYPERRGMVMTLTYFGYGFDEILQLIFSMSKWRVMDRDTTIQYARKAYEDKRRMMLDGRGVNQHAPNACFLPRPKLTPWELVDRFFRETLPVLPMFDIPGTVDEAAEYYREKGFHPFPMRKAKKKPMYRFRKGKVDYCVVQPVAEDVNNWNWSYGLILLGTAKYCFLDVDVKHDDGLRYIDIRNMFGRHFEISPSGGLHIYGIGELSHDIKNRTAGPIEVKGEGKYIIAYPTQGYKLSRQ